MTPQDEFEELGRKLFSPSRSGHGWKRNFSALTGTPYDTVRGWATYGPPNAVLYFMRNLSSPPPLP